MISSTHELSVLSIRHFGPAEPVGGEADPVRRALAGELEPAHDELAARDP